MLGNTQNPHGIGLPQGHYSSLAASIYKVKMLLKIIYLYLFIEYAPHIYALYLRIHYLNIIIVIIIYT